MTNALMTHRISPRSLWSVFILLRSLFRRWFRWFRRGSPRRCVRALWQANISVSQFFSFAKSARQGWFLKVLYMVVASAILWLCDRHRKIILHCVGVQRDQNGTHPYCSNNMPFARIELWRARRIGRRPALKTTGSRSYLLFGWTLFG